ncbi:MAG: hypothetical protein LBV72_00040 [Tannerella sp.]|jgi:hypothetical protein|nr:hypothetical protein [Tannerella sp.]
MANCSCIIAKPQDEEVSVLFEGNSPLPFFWLMLLGPEDIERYQKQLEDIPQQEADQFDTTISIDKLKAISRAAERRDYVKQYYKPCSDLFDDWIYFMQTADFSDMKIYIDLYPTSLSYHTPENFTESLLKAINCFDEQKEAWYEGTIAGTCGYESRHKGKRRLSESSEAYRKLNRQNIYNGFENKIHLERKKPFKRKGRLILFFIILGIIAGLLFFLMK